MFLRRHGSRVESLTCIEQDELPNVASAATCQTCSWVATVVREGLTLPPPLSYVLLRALHVFDMHSGILISSFLSFCVQVQL